MTEMKNLKEQIAQLESTKEEYIPAEQVRAILRGVKDLFEGRLDGPELQGLYGELGDLARYINNARKELKQFQPKDVADKDIPDASQQLDAIVQQTEQATGGIMDACEQLEGINERIKDRLISHEPPLDSDVLAGVDDAVLEGQNHITRIFEACNFQDLTGQRIKKIVKTLSEIERQVLRMVVVFGLNKESGELDDSTRKELESDAELLNGPQLPGQSLEQDDIDDILDTLLGNS